MVESSIILRCNLSFPRGQVSLCLLIRKLFPTTLTLEIAIAPAATIGLPSLT
jgi:hypothetical protein